MSIPREILQWMSRFACKALLYRKRKLTHYMKLIYLVGFTLASVVLCGQIKEHQRIGLAEVVKKQFQGQMIFN